MTIPSKHICTFCGETIRETLKSEDFNVNGKKLSINNIPARYCPTTNCQAEYYSANTLSKIHIITAQFKSVANNSFNNKETIVTFPVLFLKNKTLTSV